MMMPEAPLDNARPRLWAGTAGDRSNEPLVLLHGFTGTSHTWDALAERMTKEHFLIMPDLPGHGRSGIQSVGMDLDATSAAVAEILDRILEGGAQRKVALLGYSLGGRVALNFALKYQERLSCLVLESTSPGIQDRAEREARRKKDDALADDIERHGIEWFVEYWENTPLFAGQRNLHASVFDKVRRERLSNKAAGLAASLRYAGAGRMVPLWDKLQDIEIPVLLIVGDGDEKYRRIGEAMKLRTPDCSLVLVKESGHCIHIERPVEFGDALEAFLKGRASRPAGRLETRE